MPIMHRRDGFEIISFHPPSEHTSGQVHVFHGDGEVIVDLRPIGVREVYRMPPADVATAVALVDEHRADLIVRSGERFIPEIEGRTGSVTRTIAPRVILEQIPAARARGRRAGEWRAGDGGALRRNDRTDRGGDVQRSWIRHPVRLRARAQLDDTRPARDAHAHGFGNRHSLARAGH